MRDPLRALVVLFGLASIAFAVPGATAETKKSLKEACSTRFPVGTATEGTLNPAEMQLLVKQFGTVTPENCMKMDFIHPGEDRFNFGPADALVDLASAHGLTVNAHTLVWHSQCPRWIFAAGNQPAGRDLVLQRMRTHIAQVAGHFAGKVKSWDVVNEAIDDGNGYLRNSKWLSTIGEDFIAQAFQAARQADPQAELLYNDYGIECQPKRDKALRLLRDLKKRGIPIDGIGIQGHWLLDGIPFQDIEDAIVAFHAEGVRVAITELDLDVIPRETAGADVGSRQDGGPDPFRSGLPADLQQRLAAQYAQLFSLFLKHQEKIGRVTLWGFHDGRSWLNYWPYRRTNHPMLWDRTLQPKPAYEAVLSVLRNTQTHSKDHLP